MISQVPMEKGISFSTSAEWDHWSPVSSVSLQNFRFQLESITSIAYWVLSSPFLFRGSDESDLFEIKLSESNYLKVIAKSERSKLLWCSSSYNETRKDFKNVNKEETHSQPTRANCAEFRFWCLKEQKDKSKNEKVLKWIREQVPTVLQGRVVLIFHSSRLHSLQIRIGTADFVHGATF